MIYLNHAGTSWPKPDSVIRAAQSALTAHPEEWPRAIQEDHQTVCSAFCIESPDRLLITPGGTSALAIGIADHAWQKGDRLLISSWEHHAVHRPAQQLRALGVSTEVIPGRSGEPVDLGALKQLLAEGGVRLVAVTSACNVTGELLPVEVVAAMAREYGALCLVDIAQTAGWMDVDVRTLSADLIAFTSHKGLQAPWGTGGLYVAPGVSMASPRAVCDVLGFKHGGVCAPMPGYCDAGSINRPALAGLAQSVRRRQEAEGARGLIHARRCIDHLAGALEKTGGYTLRGDLNSNSRMPSLAVTPLDRSLAEVGNRLREHHIAAATGQLCAPLANETLGTFPGGVLRFSAGPGTSMEEMDEVIRVLGLRS